MPYNWQITVSTPVLLAGMSFKVRYRQLPSTTWTPFLPNPTTNTFTIPNLTDGTWEVEIITVCANGKLSPPRYHQKTFGNVCCAPQITSATANTGGGGGNRRNLRFHNNAGGGMLRVWIANPLNGAPDIELPDGGIQSVSVNGAFTFYWAFIDTGTFASARLQKIDGSGGQSLNFTSGFPANTNPENTVCQSEQNNGGVNQMQCSGSTLPTGDPNTDFYLQPCTSQSLITIQNNSTVGDITDVTPAFYLISSGAFPITSGSNIMGIHGGYGSNISVNVTSNGAQQLTLLVNSNLIETIPVSSSGTYTFAAYPITGSDTITIIYEDIF